MDRKFYVICADDCRIEGMSKEQIFAAIAEATGKTPTEVDAAFITQIKESNAGKNLYFWLGTQAQYNALAVKDHTSCFYILTDCLPYADVVQIVKDHIANTNNPHKVTAEQVGARPNTWMPTAEEVGAIPVINYNNTGCYYRESGGVVEWINPPLALNEEYRTIERYKGLPVYVKTCDLDLAPQGSKHVWIASGITNVVSIDGYVFTTEGSQITLPIAMYASNMPMNIYGNLVFNVTESAIAHVIAKYTK